MNGELSFFELGVDDVARARRFYGGLFDWEFADEGTGTTIETPNVPGGLHGNDPGASPYLILPGRRPRQGRGAGARAWW